MSVGKKIEQFSREKTKVKPASGFSHFQRIHKSAKKILEIECLNYDAEVLHAACFLHDIEADHPHHEKSADRASILLKETSFPPDKAQKVRHAILEHVPDGKPKDIEAIALHDADLLDFLGATGVTRLSYATSAWLEKINLQDTLKTLKLYRKKAFKNLIFKTSKKIAKKKIKFMDLAIETLDKELKWAKI